MNAYLCISVRNFVRFVLTVKNSSLFSSISVPMYPQKNVILFILFIL